MSLLRRKARQQALHCHKTGPYMRLKWLHCSGRAGNRPTFSCLGSVSPGPCSVNLSRAPRDMDLEGLNAHTKVQTVWHNDAQHRLVTSAYNPGVRSALVVQLRPPKVLGAGAAASGGEERAALEAQIQGSEQVRAFAGNPHSACFAGPCGEGKLFARHEQAQRLTASLGSGPGRLPAPIGVVRRGFAKSQMLLCPGYEGLLVFWNP